MLAFSGVCSVFLVSWLGAADVADIVALRVAAYSCWLVGGMGLWALLSEEALNEDSQSLASLRGTRLENSDFAAVGVMRQLSRAMLWASMPGLVAAFFVSTHPSMFAQRFALLLCMYAYLVSLALVLGLVALFCIRISPRRAKWMAAAIIVGPFLLSLTTAYPISIPGLYIWGFEKLFAWGGLVA